MPSAERNKKEGKMASVQGNEKRKTQLVKKVIKRGENK